MVGSQEILIPPPKCFNFYEVFKHSMAALSQSDASCNISMINITLKSSCKELSIIWDQLIVDGSPPGKIHRLGAPSAIVITQVCMPHTIWARGWCDFISVTRKWELTCIMFNDIDGNPTLSNKNSTLVFLIGQQSCDVVYDKKCKMQFRSQWRCCDLHHLI